MATAEEASSPPAKLASTRVHAILEEDEEEWEEICAVVEATPEIPETELEFELEDAFMDQMPYIVINHRKLGGDTAVAISIGNFMHKSAVLSAAACLIAGPGLKQPVFAVPAGVLSGLCVVMYDLSWAYDPCCKYQVVAPSKFHLELPMYESLNETCLPNMTVLVRRDDLYARGWRKRLHNTLAMGALGWAGYHLYKWYRGA